MDKFINGHFYNPTKGTLTYDEVMKEILSYMKEKSDTHYEVVVGCDSSSGEDPDFPVVVVVLRKREGGRFFIKKVKYSEKRPFLNFKLRILQEVLLSCEFGIFLKKELEEKAKEMNYEFKYIHADIGGNGATKDMIKEVVGLIQGNGFEPKIKPEAFAATNVADRYT